MSDYNHPNWQRRRLQKLDKAKWQCQECGAKERQLHVHHLDYRRGAAPWEYEDDELRCLCVDCHSKFHEDKRRLMAAFGVLDNDNRDIVMLVAEHMQLTFDDKFIEMIYRHLHEFDQAVWEDIRTSLERPAA